MQIPAILKLVFNEPLWRMDDFGKLQILTSNILNTTGWDTDQFMMDVGEATLVMLTVIKNVSWRFVGVSWI